MAQLINLVAHLPDAAILIVGAVSTAIIALAVAWLARRFWFSPHNETLEPHAKLADLVHGSLLAFCVFVLALVLSDVRANLGRADDAALREGSAIARVDRELQAIGADAATARERLKDYARAIVADEWKTLAERTPALSAGAERALITLVAETRRLALAKPEEGGALRPLVSTLEDLRQGRLEFATKTVPTVFWWVIALFLIGAMAMYGRNPLDATGMSLIVLHMAAIGLVVALIIALDEPFRGESSISPAPIAKAAGL
jgi:hypothetical protein